MWPRWLTGLEVLPCEQKVVSSNPGRLIEHYPKNEMFAFAEIGGVVVFVGCDSDLNQLQMELW